ncbi:hypothetical protein H310_09610 [Aphanomyces invadans]|uniref:Uncharacterized protein n=1 Tax=Aphanomyces invadans TaxID=157072 RepID=A0A024TT86_9STRA|nr:hypothetical protein H310_09610 [Aphanomyces invadans]ETV97229.1 hypothetical protein H310_09610 [Aphanomyces invadans]RHY22721.1 hypothetical protein DYB32_009416 [Aphanomyces invadans]|eukprot:XP_008873937.1 hypothetical protein H310_09610 [Aphanomyces invadans]
MVEKRVLVSTDLMQCIGAFQRGVLQDMLPLVSPAPDTRHRYRRWYAAHGAARLPLLLKYMPHLAPLVILHAVAANHMHVLDALHLTIDDHDDLVAVAAATGHVAAIVQLHAMEYMSGTNAAMVVAATHGHVNVVEYLVSTRRSSKQQTSRAIVAAAQHGHLNVVQFLHVHLKSADASKAAVRMAAAHGHLHVVAWLHESGAHDWSSDAFTLAAAGGHLNVLAYMHRVKPRRGASKQAMDSAATSGHLHIVKFLHCYRPEDGCTDKALEGAASNGHKDVVEYLTMHRDQLIHAMCSACGFHKPRNHKCKVAGS